MARVGTREISYGIFLIVGALMLLSGCQKIFLRDASERTQLSPSPAGEVAVFSSDVIMYKPLSNDTVSGTFEISGRAAEGVTAVFVSVEDKNFLSFATTSLPVVSGYFNGTVAVSYPPVASGVLSVAPIYGDGSAGSSFGIPIYFGSYQTAAVSVFFSNVIRDPEAKNCNSVYSVPRQIPVSGDSLRAALSALIAGPTDDEVAQGYISNISESGVAVNRVEFRGNAFFVDFNQALEKDVSGDCRIAALRAQIEETLKQFATSSPVFITIDGAPSTIFQ